MMYVVKDSSLVGLQTFYLIDVEDPRVLQPERASQQRPCRSHWNTANLVLVQQEPQHHNDPVLGASMAKAAKVCELCALNFGFVSSEVFWDSEKRKTKSWTGFSRKSPSILAPLTQSAPPLWSHFATHSTRTSWVATQAHFQRAWAVTPRWATKATAPLQNVIAPKNCSFQNEKRSRKCPEASPKNVRPYSAV